MEGKSIVGDVVEGEGDTVVYIEVGWDGVDCVMVDEELFDVLVFHDDSACVFVFVSELLKDGGQVHDNL